MPPGRPNPLETGEFHVWIVDCRPGDYDRLRTDPGCKPLGIQFLASGRELLRRWPAGPPDLCLVNVELPGLSGFDVVEMLQPFPGGTTVCMVADRYRPEDEVRALSLGAHRFLCKPVEPTFVFEWCARHGNEKGRGAAPGDVAGSCRPPKAGKGQQA